MIEIGKYSKLKVLKKLDSGFVVGEESGEQLTLMAANCSKSLSVGDEVKVYVYRDYENKKIASCLIPKIDIDQFAFLEVIEKVEDGVLVDWGMESLLLVPKEEHKQKLEVGSSYFIYLDIEEETSTFYGSNYIDEWLQNDEIELKEDDQVEVLIWRKTDLGYAVIVNNEHEGLVYQNEVFKEVEIGQKLDGYIKKIREENKLDISLQPLGFRKAIDKFTTTILTKLEEGNGFLPFTDKSSPEEIYNQFGMSKKAFKKAIGGLYKERKIIIQPKGITLKK
jgi:predicted RNA-binding protein (virulence factor B family)